MKAIMPGALRLRLYGRGSAGGAGQPTNGDESPPQGTGEANGN
jgi:hypothetical protein